MKDRLRLSRERAGLDQEELAERLDIVRATVSNYERGISIPKAPMLAAWALATGVDMDWLRDGDAGLGGGPGGQVRPGAGAGPNERTDSGTVIPLFGRIAA